jgi:hypothetical protein
LNEYQSNIEGDSIVGRHGYILEVFVARGKWKKSMIKMKF